MFYILTLPFYILFFFFMVYAALAYWPMIMTIVFLGLFVMFLPK